MSVIRSLAALGVAAQSSAVEAAPLSAYRWKSRVLLISSDDARDPKLRAQRAALAAEKAGIAERDLVVIEAIGASPEAERLRRELGLKAAGFQAVLVGKDGEAKISQAEPIPTMTLFSAIDAMPMRRQKRGR